VEEVGKASAWTRRWWRQHGIETGVEEERTHDVDSVAVREVVGETSAWTRRRWRQRGIEEWTRDGGGERARGTRW
jgi:hypothetical protein